MTPSVWGTLPLILCLPLSAKADTATVLGDVILGESKIGGEKIGEFSALVRDPDGTGVIAISDRGYLAKLDLMFTDGRLTGVIPVSAHVLKDATGTALRDQDFNPEAAALRDDGTLAIVSEAGPRLAIFDTTGLWLRDEPLPAGVADPALQASKKDGIEALGWTAATGYLAITEEPQLGNPRDRHTVFSTMAGHGVFSTGTADSISIKGMETDGQTIMVIERTRDDVTEDIRPWLRRIDISTCLGMANCPSEQIDTGLTTWKDADFEGIAALGDGKYLIVSDDRIDGDLRSIFVLLHVPE